MSERDCGRWYCQPAYECDLLIEGEDFLLYPGPVADPFNLREVVAERIAITGRTPVTPGGWMGQMRAQYGDDIWLAAFNHGHGKAGEYWVWDPDSRGHYFEAVGPFEPGTLPSTVGPKNADGTGAEGMGWQLPLLAVFTGRPTAREIEQLEVFGVPYTVLDAPPDPEPEPDECPPCPPCEPCQVPARIDLALELEAIKDGASALERAAQEVEFFATAREIRQQIINPLRRLLRKIR